MRHSSPLAVAATLIAANLLFACAGTVVSVPRTAPAEINLAGYKRMAIGGLTGEGSDLLVNDLTEAVFATKRFELLDRKSIDAVMAEQNLSISGLVNSETAVPIGEMLGSAALVVGEITAVDYKEDVTSRQQKCKKTENKKVIEYPCTHYTRVANASLNASLKVIDTTTGKLLAAKSLTGQVNNRKKAVDQEPPPFNSREPWLAQCRKQIATNFAQVIAPHEIRVSVQLLEDGDLPELEQGNNYAKLGKWMEAIGKYQAALARANEEEFATDTKAKAHYNIGIGFGYSGQYDTGIRSLEEAYSLDPQQRYLGQVAVIKKFKDDDAKLAEQQAGNYDAGIDEDD
jgi:tetratricopeptide (TPR) repeat protein